MSHTHGAIIKKIKFFETKDPDFLWALLPKLKPLKVYEEDVLYNQGDTAEEVFFILKGRVKLYCDANEGDEKLGQNPLPFNLYVEGSYFGDSDVLGRDVKDGRDGSAIAEV